MRIVLIGIMMVFVCNIVIILKQRIFCPKWTDEDIEFDYNRVYHLCQQYINICHMFEKYEKMKERNPDGYLSMSNLHFFLNCCCNDLAREFSLYEMRK